MNDETPRNVVNTRPIPEVVLYYGRGGGGAAILLVLLAILITLLFVVFPIPSFCLLSLIVFDIFVFLYVYFRDFGNKYYVTNYRLIKKGPLRQEEISWNEFASFDYKEAWFQQIIFIYNLKSLEIYSTNGRVMRWYDIPKSGFLISLLSDSSVFQRVLESKLREYQYYPYQYQR